MVLTVTFPTICVYFLMWSSDICAHRLPWWNVQSLGARFADESVLELDAGERASGHHGIVPSAGAVRVKLPRCQAERNMDKWLAFWRDLAFCLFLI